MLSRHDGELPQGTEAAAHEVILGGKVGVECRTADARSLADVLDGDSLVAHVRNQGFQRFVELCARADRAAVHGTPCCRLIVHRRTSKFMGCRTCEAVCPAKLLGTR